jgi:hypothetical protein
LFPVAAIAKLTKKNPLHLKKEDNDTVFTERNHKYSAKDLEQVW